MKICIFGCKSITIFLASHIHRRLGVQAITTISPEHGRDAQVADYLDVREWAADHSIAVHTASRYDLKTSGDRDYFNAQDFDIGLVAGWQRLIPAELLNSFRIGVFGMHGSAFNLPAGRGRSPMNWALIEGRRLFYTNLFCYDPGVDSGEILDTQAFSITDEDTAETLHYKNVMSMVHLVLKNAEALKNGTFSLKKQSNQGATYYPKRVPENSLIDWGMPIDALHRFIRAVAPPFNGAFTYLNGRRVTLKRAAIFEMDTVPFYHTDAESGDILEVFPSGKLLVKARGGSLIVHEHNLDGNDLPVPGDHFTSPEADLKVFEKNRFGGHDLP